MGTEIVTVKRTGGPTNRGAVLRATNIVLPIPQAECGQTFPMDAHAAAELCAKLPKEFVIIDTAVPADDHQPPKRKAVSGKGGR